MDIPDACKDVVKSIENIKLLNRDIIIKNVKVSATEYSSRPICQIELTDSTTEYLKNSIPGAEYVTSYIEYDPVSKLVKSISFNRILPTGYFEMVVPTQCKEYLDTYCEIAVDVAKSMVTFNARNIGTIKDIKELITDFYGKF
ncbi:MAG: hypothetical protein ACP5GJ_02710 [Nanopusillaceae archaeon]